MMKNQTGFTLMEVVMVVIVLGITAVMLTPIITRLVTGPESERRIEAAILAQQQCAERILAARSVGYTSLNGTVCSTLPVVDGVIATALITTRPAGSVAACPSGMECKEVTIEAKVNNITKSSINIPPVQILFPQY